MPSNISSEAKTLAFMFGASLSLATVSSAVMYLTEPSLLGLLLREPPPTLDITLTAGGTLLSSGLMDLPRAAACKTLSRLAVMISIIFSSCCSTVRLVCLLTNASPERPPQTSLPSVAR